jgi:hypothetical protein
MIVVRCVSVSVFEGWVGYQKAECPTTLHSDKSKKETKSCISRFSAFFWEAVIIMKGPHVDTIPSMPLPKVFNPL